MRLVAVLVLALVGERREELVQEVAVRRVQLDARRSRCASRAAAEATKASTSCRISADGQLVRHVPALAEWQSATAPRVGHGDWSGAERTRALPTAPATKPCGRRGASWMPIGFLRQAAAGVDHALHRRLVVLAVEAGAAVRDAAFARHVGRLDHHQPGAAVGEVAEVHEVPVVHAAVVGGVLAHRRDDDAVGQRDAAEVDRREKSRRHAAILGQGRATAPRPRCRAARTPRGSPWRTPPRPAGRRGGRACRAPPARACRRGW